MTGSASWSRRAAALMLVAAVFASPITHARSLVMATVNWAPFYGEDLPRQGFFTALSKAAFAASGHQVEVQFMPWARAMLEVEQGDRDLLMGAYYSEERAQTFAVSESVYSTKVGLVARADLGVEEFESLRDLTEYTIGYGRGWATSDEFDNAEYLDKEAADNNVLNVRKLYKGRIDMIAMNFDRFNRIASENGFDPSEVVFLEPALKSSGLYVMASPELEDREQVIADFNSGLAKIRENGTYDRILEEMGYAR